MVTAGVDFQPEDMIMIPDGEVARKVEMEMMKEVEALTKELEMETLGEVAAVVEVIGLKETLEEQLLLP